jgi:dTMP kinase
VAGVLIAFEGPEGSGKSTQARRLAERLSAAGVDVVLTREPGGTAIGEQIRAIVLDPANCAMLAETEALLYSAARAQHVGEVIRPALERGAVVVCDRYADSTLAYQGGGRGLAIDGLRAIQELATGGLEPSLRILLDLPVEVGLARRLGSGEEVNRLDLAEFEFHRRVRSAYRELAAADPGSWATIDADQPTEDVTEQIVRTVTQRVGLGLPT